MQVPETRYARSGDVNIAYQVVGDGPVDLLWIPVFAQHIELSWEEPYRRAWLEALAAEYRLIVFDKRGTGLSDRVVGAPPVEVRMDDCRVVLDAAGSQRAAILTLVIVRSRTRFRGDVPGAGARARDLGGPVSRDVGSGLAVGASARGGTSPYRASTSGAGRPRCWRSSGSWRRALTRLTAKSSPA